MANKSRHLPGIRLADRKGTEGRATEKVPIPALVLIPMVQHIGAACVPLVRKGDVVLAGQVIGDSDAYVCAPVHASVSGLVTAVEPMLCFGNRQVLTVSIKPDAQQRFHPDLAPPVIVSRESFLKAVRASGLTGLGGAGFPAHVKLNPPKGANLDLFIVNAAECEPFITSDYRECIEYPSRIIEGIRTILLWTGVERAVIGIEDNKPEAVETLRKACGGDGRITVQVLKSRYPQGAERVLIHTLTGRRVKTGKLPADVGCLVMNVTSVSFLQSYFETGMPLMRKRVTVDGPLIVRPGNMEAVIGTPLSDVFAACGGLTGTPEKIIMGGPMMGVSMHSAEVPVIKNTNALLVMDHTLAGMPPETPCIRCGRCAHSCPMGMLPMEINRVVVSRSWEELHAYAAMDCIECGCCSYACPAGRYLVQSIRLAKEHVRKHPEKAKVVKA
jgi:electron transport complex protein RnfC